MDAGTFDIDKFKTIESQYQFYLSLMGLNESVMPAGQKREMRRCFYGACGQMLVYIQNLINNCPVEKGYRILNDMETEIQTFFVDDVKKQANA